MIENGRKRLFYQTSLCKQKFHFVKSIFYKIMNIKNLPPPIKSDDYKEVDYNHEDYESIKNYMQSQGGECSVKNIKKCSGAHPLRIYPVLFRMEKENELEVIEQTLFGAPLQVRLKNKEVVESVDPKRQENHQQLRSFYIQ